MQKSFDITIDDQQPVNPNNSFAIYRGDNVAFNFTFQRGGIPLDVDGATLRVFAKKIGKNGAVDKLSLPLFAGDFTETNTATFNSSQTAGDAGNYILSVLLVSSDDAVITSQCIYFELKENGYAGVYQPSADYRDEVLDASELAQQSATTAQTSATNAQASAINAQTSATNAQQSATNASTSEANANLYSTEASNYSNVALQSKEQAEQFLNETIVAKNEAVLAKEQAQEISDPENRIGNLQQTKANRGEFWFNGGFLQNDTLKYSQGNPFSFAVNFRANKADIVGAKKQVNIFDGGILYLYFPASNPRLAFYAPSGVLGITYISQADNDRLLNGQWHTLVISYDGTTLKLTDETGVLVSASATLQSQAPASAINLGNNLIGQMRSIKYFNFDMSSDDAPYTIADYISGKDESPLLSGTLLSLDDYIFNGKIFDTSGNNNTATITGVVKGSKDNAIEQMYQAFASRIGNLTE